MRSTPGVADRGPHALTVIPKALLFLQDVRPSGGALTFRCFFYARCHKPYMASWIENSSRTVTPELVLRERQYRCTGVARSLCDRVHIGHVDKNDDRGATVALRRTTR